MKRAILLIDHGSVREEANTTLRQMAQRVQSLAGDAAIVRYAHMELAEPSIAHAVRECVEAGAEEIVAMPYMLAPGRHASTDIPRLVESATAQHPGLRFRMAPPLGVHPLLATVVLDRCGIPAKTGSG